MILREYKLVSSEVLGKDQESLYISPDTKLIILMGTDKFTP
jgi:hypothetical protein